MDRPERQANAITPERRWHQYSLWTLLVLMTFAAGLCSIGVYTGWVVAGAILAAAAVGGIAGMLVTRTPQGFPRGVRWGVHCALAAVLATTLYCLYAGYLREGDEQESARFGGETRSTEELLKAVQAMVPSARPIPGGAEVEQMLPAYYGHGGPYPSGGTPDRSGDELFLLPDKTYLYARWEELFVPRNVSDKGVWVYERGVIVLHSDGPIRQNRGPRDMVYLPLTVAVSPWFASQIRQKEYVLLLGTEDGMRRLQRIAPFLHPGWDDHRMFLAGYPRGKTISASEANAVRAELFAKCIEWAPDWLRWQLRVPKLATASGVMLAMWLAGLVSLRRGQRRSPTRESAPPEIAPPADQAR